MENNEFLFKIGQKIRILRTLKGLSQEKLAEISDTDRGHISNIELGKKNVSILYLKQVAEALECEISDLLDFTI